MQNKIFILIGAILAISGCAGLSDAKPFYQAHTQVELISPTKSIKPGEPLLIGLRLKMDPQWHVYWKNPGDSGLQPTIAWDLPEGFIAGEIIWPYPQMINVVPLRTYGYENEVFLFSSIQTPAKIDVSSIIIKAKVDWLACKLECIPGRAQLQLHLPVSNRVPTVNLTWQKALEESRKEWPLNLENIHVAAREKQGDLILEFSPASLIKPNSQIYFFPDSSEVIEHASEQVLTKTENKYTLTVKKSHLAPESLNFISGIVVNQSGWENVDYPQALAVKTRVDVVEPPVLGMSTDVQSKTTAGQVSLTLLVACFFAFLGGLILNLMPCVLPVLSLKVLHLIEQSHTRKNSFLNGLVFGAGVLISFWILALGLIALRSLGVTIGWGFQFQSPAFVALIAMVLFIFALNLFGLFEVGVGLTSFGNAAWGKKGYSASFAAGVLATIVATPCTAPFMGTALSFALSRSAGEAFLIFTFLGIGMAFPVVFLSYFPKLLKRIPKPGAWMIMLKNLLGFVLLLSVIWLVWVFGLQKGINAVAELLVAFLSLSVGLYFYGKSQVKTKQSFLIKYNFFIFIILGIILIMGAISRPSVVVENIEAQSESNTAMAWQKYSPELMMELKKQDRPIFLDFTAAWCLSCQVNDRLALSDAQVIVAFKTYDIVPVKADWTNGDPAITAALHEYGRNSIPLYVLYPGRGVAPVFLPEVITPAVVLSYFRKHLERN